MGTLPLRDVEQCSDGTWLRLAYTPKMTFRLRVCVTLLAAALLPFAAAFGQAKPQEFRCPETLPAVDQSLTTVPAGWQAAKQQIPLWLAGITLFDGPVDQNVALAPDERGKAGAKVTDVWDLDASSERLLWMQCNYANTTITLSKLLGMGFRECTATYDPQVRVAGQPAMEHLRCRERIPAASAVNRLSQVLPFTFYPGFGWCALIHCEVMARSVNKVILIGNLGKDAETKFTPGGRSRTTFTVATSRSWKDAQTGEMREQTDWHNIVLWGQERVGEYLKKGKQIYLEGRLTSRSYETNEGKTAYITEVVCDNVMLLGSGGGGGGEEGGSYSGGGYSRGERSSGGGSGGGSRPQQRPADEGFAASDDDVPF